MFTIGEIRELEAWRVLSPKGKEYVEHAVTSSPSRTVGVGGLVNQSGVFCSATSGHTVQWESRSVELVFLHHMELDPQLGAIWDQPPQLPVTRHDLTGRRDPGVWTPDYLVLRGSHLYLTECKRLEELTELAGSRPADWCCSAAGLWSWNVGIETCAELGLRFDLFHSGMYTPIVAANLRALVTVSTDPLSVAEKNALAMVGKALSDRPLTHTEILHRFARVTGDMLFRGLLAGAVHGALSTALLGDSFYYYGEQADAEARERAIVQAVERSNRPVGSFAQRLVSASHKEIARAEAALKKYRAGRSSGNPLSSTEYRLRSSLQRAAEEGAPAICAFIQRTGDRGRKPHIPETAFELMKKIALEHVQNSPRPHLTAAYGEFLNAAEEKKEYIATLETFRQVYNGTLSPEKRALATRGKRGFHAERASTDPRKRCVEAPLPGLFAHIDCTPGDVVGTHDEEIGDWPRPVVIPLIDQETGFVFGRGYVFGSVSKLAPATALCDCVARHGFLPRNIAYDGGSEFNNKYLSKTFAIIDVNAVYRPKSAAQWGSRVEGFFAQLSSFVQQIDGGLANDKRGRESDGKKKGRRNAIHQISKIIETIDHWIFDIYNKLPLRDEIASPYDLFMQGRKAFPSCCVSLVDDQAFRIATSVSIGALRRDTWDRKKGIRFGGTSFSSTELSSAHLAGAKLADAGLDARDPSVMYVQTTHGVIRAFAPNNGELEGQAECLKLAHHTGLVEYHSRAKKNQTARKRKEATVLSALKNSSRFCHQHTLVEKPEAAPAPAEKDDFESIEVANIPKFKIRKGRG